MSPSVFVHARSPAVGQSRPPVSGGAKAVPTPSAVASRASPAPGHRRAYVTLLTK